MLGRERRQNAKFFPENPVAYNWSNSINFVSGFEEKNREKKKYTNKGCVFTPFDI